MGSALSFFNFLQGQHGTDDDLVNLKTGFTRKQTKLMKKTWDEFIRNDLIDVGVIAMLRQVYIFGLK